VPSIAFRKNQLEDLLFRLAEQGKALNGSELVLLIRSDETTLEQTAVSQGWELVETSNCLSIELAEAPVISVPLGIRFVSVSQMIAEGIDWMRPLYQATLEINRDIPTELDAEDVSFEQFEALFQNEQVCPRDRMFAAMAGDSIVAFLRYQPNSVDATRARVEFGGTAREWRRKGVMTALKQFSHASLYRAGVRRLFTYNLGINPMVAINHQLGFQEHHRISTFRRSL
jgi:hypothetical protein